MPVRLSQTKVTLDSLPIAMTSMRKIVHICNPCQTNLSTTKIEIIRAFHSFVNSESTPVLKVTNGRGSSYMLFLCPIPDYNTAISIHRKPLISRSVSLLEYVHCKRRCLNKLVLRHALIPPAIEEALTFANHKRPFCQGPAAICHSLLG